MMVTIKVKPLGAGNMAEMLRSSECGGKREMMVMLRVLALQELNYRSLHLPPG